jgi:DNA-binding winged helix-turn-helix (wHTH) protein/tetratricopeptide (TPR) repeat protein
MNKEGKDIYEFGPFRVDPSQRLLFRNNQTVPLQPKAFDTLLVLVQNSGRVVLKEELMKTVWPETFVEESNLTQNIFVLRKILEETPGQRRYIVTVPGRGYRFAEDVRTISEEEEIVVESHLRSRVVIEEEDDTPVTDIRAKANRLNLRVALPASAAVLALAAGGFWFFRPTAHKLTEPKLTEKDTVVLADFANQTGDPVFDGPLRRGLAAQLEQSPFLNLLSDQRIAQTLTLMARPRDTRLTPEVAREVCQRTASAALLTGVIGQVGSRYLLTLSAINCANGESLASAEVQAVDKNHVLDALGKTATAIRAKLGESLVSVRRYDAPTESVTTSSLEALQAYNLGYQAMTIKGDGLAAIPLFQRAVSLDPNFAMAYARMGTAYFNFDQAKRAAANLQKAYDLRDRVSERERFYIDAHHADIVTRDFEAARKVYELWGQIYPRDEFPLGNLAVINGFLGYYDKGLAANLAAHKLNPGNGNVLNNISIGLTQLNRLEDAKAALRDAESLHPDYPGIHSIRYTIAFLEHDTPEMDKQAAALMGVPGWEDSILYNQSETAAYGGHFLQARELTRRAAESARRADKKETASVYEAEAAVREALVGNYALARKQARTALQLSQDRDVEAISAVALGLAGDTAQATRLAGGLGRDFPQDTIVQFNTLPAILAAAALGSDPRKAIQTLAVSTPYEFGQTTQLVVFCLYPVYLRGEAYLAARQGPAAAAEFQKVLDHWGPIQNETIGSLSHLGLARAYGMAGESAKAKAAYQDFLALWKNADPDIPVLRQAKAEYAKLE